MHLQTFFDKAGQCGPLPGGKRFGLHTQSVLNVQRGSHKSIVCCLIALAQRDSYKFAFADLHYVAAGRKFQRPVAHHTRIDPYAAAFYHAGCITA